MNVTHRLSPAKEEVRPKKPRLCGPSSQSTDDNGEPVLPKFELFNMEPIEKTFGSKDKPRFEPAIWELLESLACTESYALLKDRNMDIDKPNMQIDDSNMDTDENVNDNITNSLLTLYGNQPYELGIPHTRPSHIDNSGKDKVDKTLSPFWAWCGDDFLRPITEDDLEEFRELFVDEFCSDFSSLMVNEKSTHTDGRRMPESEESWKTVKEEECWDDQLSPQRPINEQVEELIRNICGANQKNNQTQPPSCYEELPCCSEEADEGHFSASLGPYDDFDGSRHTGEGSSSVGTAITRLTLPLRLLPIIKLETQDFTLPPDILVMNDSSTEECDEHSEMVCDDSEYDDYLNIIKEVDPEGIENLIRMGVIPEYFRAYCYEASSQCSTEGKQISAGELDEVSAELLKCQQELDQLKPDLQVLVGHCWLKLQADFAYEITERELNEADHELFGLADDVLSGEDPNQRPRDDEDWPELEAAIKRRNKLARRHYGKPYKKVALFANDELEDK